MFFTRSFWITTLAFTSICLLGVSHAEADHTNVDEVRTFIEQEQWEAAENKIKQLDKQHPGNAEIIHLRGEVKERIGKFRAAERYYQSSMNSDSNYLPAIHGLLRIYEKNNNDKRRNIYSRLSDLDDKNPTWPYRIAAYDFSKKRLTFEPYLLKALELNPNHRASLDLIVRLYKKLHKRKLEKKYKTRLVSLVGTQNSDMSVQEDHQTHLALSKTNGKHKQKSAKNSTSLSTDQSKSHKTRKIRNYDPSKLAQQDIEDSITDTIADVQRMKQTIGMSKDRLSILESDIYLKRSEVEAVNEKLQKQKNRLAKLQALGLDDEEIAQSERRVQKKYHATRHHLTKVKAELEALQNVRVKKIKLLRTQENALKRRQNSITALKKEIARMRMAALRTKVEQVHLVDARGEYSCGEYNIANCKRLAMQEAERVAIEQGTAVIVESLTEVENFELVSDKIRTSARAIILDKKVLDGGMIGESAYFYSIRAHVKGQMPKDLTGRSSQKKSKKVVRRYRLIVQPIPSYAKVQVTNIKELYKPGMILKAGIYKLKLSSPGYNPIRMNIEIIDSDMTVPIVMSRSQDQDEQSRDIAKESGTNPERRPSTKVIQNRSYREHTSDQHCDDSRARELLMDADAAYSPTSKVRYLQKAVQLCPSDSQYGIALGNAIFDRRQSGDLELSIRMLSEIVQNEPDNRDASDSLARVMKIKQEKDALNAKLKNFFSF